MATANEKYDALSYQKRHVVLGLLIAQIAVISPFAWEAASVLWNDIGPLDPGFEKPDLAGLRCLESATTVVVEPCSPNDRICEERRELLVEKALPSAINQGVLFRVITDVAELLPSLGGSEAEDEGAVRKWLDANTQSPHNETFTVVYHFSRGISGHKPYNFFVSSGNLGWINVDASDENAVGLPLVAVHFWRK